MLRSLPVRPFRPSLRDAVASGVVLAALTWLALRLGLRAEAHAAASVTIAALGTLLAVRLGPLREQATVRVTEAGLEVRERVGIRHIAWGAITRVGLIAGDIETPRGPMLIHYARLDLAHGPPVAFADLSPLGGRPVVLPDAASTVVNVGDPEILLGIVVERVGIEHFLPRDSRPPRKALVPVDASWPQVALRAALIALIALRVGQALRSASTERVVGAMVGITGAVALATVVHALAARWLGPWRSEAALLATLLATLGATVLAHMATLKGAYADAGAWALSAGLLLALPVGPMPGGALTRALASHAARRTDDQAAVVLLTLCTGAAAALLAKGATLLPLALAAAAAEGADRYVAAVRHERLSCAPRFAAWPPEALARLRELLRPAPANQGSARRVLEESGAMRRIEAADAAWTPGARALAFSIAALMATATVAALALPQGGAAAQAVSVLLR